MPLILAKDIRALAANIGRSVGTLKVSIRNAQQEIGVCVSRSDARTGIKIKLAVCVVGINQILLVGRETGPEFPVVFSLGPGERVCPRKRIFNVACGTILAGPDLKAGIEIYVGGACGDIRSNTDA